MQQQDRINPSPNPAPRIERRSAAWQRIERFGAPILILFLTLLPRAIYPVTRKWLWLYRSVRFGDALLAGAWADTYQQYHPGVTVMWLSGLGVKLYARLRGLSSEQILGVAPAPPGAADQAIAAGVLVLSLAIAVCAIASYLILVRLTGRQAAFAASVLLALDPFAITAAKEIHLNALLSALMLTSVLLYFLYLERGRRGPLIGSGVLAGLAFLTKAPSIVLLPFVLAAAAGRRLLKGGMRAALSGWKRDGTALLLWCLAALVVFWALWPAMWVEPFQVLRRMAEGLFFHVETVHENEVYFAGQNVDDPGPLFYVATLAWKSTLVSLPMAAAALLWTLRSRRQRTPTPAWTCPSAWMTWLLAAYALLFAVEISLGSWKQMSYLLPAFGALDVMAGIGLARNAQAAGARLRKSARPASGRLAAGLILLPLALQAGIVLARHPYYGTHHNLLLGGSGIAQRVLPLQNHGEGLDLAARYLNTLPRAQNSGAWIQSHSALPLEIKYLGLTTTLPDPRASYRVYYWNEVVRGLGGEEWRLAWEADRQSEPLWSVSFDGIPYVWVYGAPPSPLAPEGSEYPVNASLGEQIALKRVRLGATDLLPGSALEVVLIWQAGAPITENYTVFCHLYSESGELVAQHDGQPASAIQPTPRWQPGVEIEDGHRLALSADLGPGEYELSAGMYEPETLRRAPAFDASGRRLPDDRIVLQRVRVQ